MIIVTTLSAQAIERDDVLRLLNAQLLAPIVQIHDADIAMNGNDVTLTNIQFGEESAATVEWHIERIVLQDIQKQSGNSYHIGKIDIPNISYRATGGGDVLRIKIDQLSGENLILNTTPLIDKLRRMAREKHFDIASPDRIFEKVSISRFEIVFNDLEIMSFVGFSIDNLIDGDNHIFIMKIGYFDYWLSRIYETFFQDNITDRSQFFYDLGLKTISGSFSINTSWNTKTGAVRLNDLSLYLINAGTLSIYASINGFSSEIYNALNDIIKQQDAGTLSKSDALAKSLDVLQKILFNMVQITYEDEGLTANLLDYKARQNAISRQDQIIVVKSYLSSSLKQFGNQQFAENNIAYIESFLRDPKNIDIIIAPQQPVSFAVIAAYMMSSSPQTVLQVLNTQIVVNQ